MTTPRTTPARHGNPFGVASLVAGVLLLLAGIVVQSSAPAIPFLLARTGAPHQVIPLVISLPSAILAVIATVLGIVGLLLRDRNRIPAIIGTTLGASHLIAAVAGLIGSRIVVALLG